MPAALALAPRRLRAAPSLDERASALDRAAAAMSAQEILAASIDEFAGRIALVSSFGAESAALLHLVAAINPALPVFFIDTGKHFVQTGGYREDLRHRLALTDVRSVRPDRAEIASVDPKGDLWRRDNDACCALRKVRPLARALKGFEAWITGRKRMHGNLRSHLPIVQAAPPHLKINPLARWSASDIAAYMTAHDLPPHPLVETGFSSIGCWPCTAPTAPGDDARAGRWRGLAKTECGIHRI
jgi:phosphoadenosine phosphosulfate reductase